MKTILEKEPSFYDNGRPHPYDGGVHDQNAKYYDFKENPELITQVLEDFIPFAQYDAIQRFYGILEWMNGEGCPLETNDCAFRYYNDETPKRAEGRVSILLRNERLNLLSGFNTLLTRIYYEHLSEIDKDFAQGHFTVKRLPTSFTNSFTEELPEGFQSAVIDSYQTIIGFEATGETIDEVMSNLIRVIKALDRVSQGVEEVFEPVNDLAINIELK